MTIADNAAARAARRSAMITGVLVGIGLVGALDEIVFHQLLQWHNFYVHTTSFWRIVSDGLFHAFTALLLFIGTQRLWTTRRALSRLDRRGPLWGGILLGAGGFQLFDGTINHKLLQIHPIREGVDNILLYDLAWNAAAVLLLIAGWLVWRASDADP